MEGGLKIHFITLLDEAPNSDLENETLFPFRHCEVASTVAISSKKARMLRFPRNDNFLYRDLDEAFILVLAINFVI